VRGFKVTIPNTLEPAGGIFVPAATNNPGQEPAAEKDAQNKERANAKPPKSGLNEELAIGLSIANIDEELAKEMDCPVTKGAVVVECQLPGSEREDRPVPPPQLPHCAAGDVITKIDATPINSEDDFLRWLDHARKGRTYRVTGYRQVRERRWTKITLSLKYRGGDSHDLTYARTDSVTDGLGDRPQNVYYRFPSRVKRFAVGGGELRVEIGSPIVYIGSRIQHRRFKFVSHWFRPSNGTVEEPDEGFYRVNKKAEEVTFESDNPKLFDLGRDDKYGQFAVFKEAGKANLVVHFLEQSFSIPIEVVRLPFDEGDESRGVVKALGLPDVEKEHTCTYPDSAVIDGIYYGPDAGEQVITAKHWVYLSHRFLVISIANGQVYSIASHDPPDEAARQKWGWGWNPVPDP
jgi:hypothetical protein